MESGIVFDVKELSVYDGPGVRVTVFLKGCPLRCAWCHNPEGQTPAPQIMVTPGGCVHCGRCRKLDCDYNRSGVCSGCGRCVGICAGGCRRVCGERITSEELAGRIERYSDMFGAEGGVTFSGGEPLYQPAFLLETLDCLRARMAESGTRFSLAMETSGFASAEVFDAAVSRCGLVYFDVKAADEAEHIKYTGVSNRPILSNLERLKRSGVPFVARIPLIPGVNDGQANLEATAEILADAPNLLRVEELPYNMAAGAKYRMVGREYRPPFEEKPPRADVSAFSARGIDAVVL